MLITDIFRKLVLLVISCVLMSCLPVADLSKRASVVFDYSGGAYCIKSESSRKIKGGVDAYIIEGAGMEIEVIDSHGSLRKVVLPKVASTLFYDGGYWHDAFVLFENGKMLIRQQMVVHLMGMFRM